jgi:hypothetical protein
MSNSGEQNRSSLVAVRCASQGKEEVVRGSFESEGGVAGERGIVVEDVRDGRLGIGDLGWVPRVGRLGFGWVGVLGGLFSFAIYHSVVLHFGITRFF